MSSKLKKRRRYYFFFSLEHFPSSFAAEPIRIAKSSLVAFERVLSSFAAKPLRNVTQCLVAFEHVLVVLNSFAAKPIRIANLTLLPRDVCGYAHANMAPLPGINIATHKSQSCCFPGVAALQNAEVSQLAQPPLPVC
jgi:hypothetical protein